MRGMFYNLNRAKQAKALMLHFHGTAKELSISEYAVLRALAERMAQKTLPRQGRRTQTIAHTCFPDLDSIARDAAMTESTVRRAIKGLDSKGLITKEVIHNWQWRGRKDYQPRHNGMRYRCTKIWDEVKLEEYGADYEEAEADEIELTEVSAEELAEADRVLAESDVPVTTKRTDITEPTGRQVDEVIDALKHYFRGHNTFTSQSEKKARSSVQPTCKDLAARALGLGAIEYAGRFLWWMINRRASVYDLLMSEKVHNLCVHFGLPKFIDQLWEQFIPEKDDQVEDLANDEFVEIESPMMDYEDELD